MLKMRESRRGDNMIKKIMILVAAILLVGTAPAFAEVPSQTIIIGSKAYDVNLLFNAAYKGEIQQAINAVPPATNQFYYKINMMTQWRTIFGNTSLTAEQIGQWPEITYIDAVGMEHIYKSGNGDEADSESFSVVDIY